MSSKSTEEIAGFENRRDFEKGDLVKSISSKTIVLVESPTGTASYRSFSGTVIYRGLECVYNYFPVGRYSTTWWTDNFVIVPKGSKVILEQE